MTADPATDERWMRHALALAARGLGAVEPNPMVGSLVLTADGQLAGQGFHEKFGGPHAEVNTLINAGEAAHGGTLYVTLEPCCHVGKTPPCTEAVLRSGVRRVVVAMPDPYPKVAGGGLAILRQAGLEVTVGDCEAEARRLNAPYLKLLERGQPWVIAKWAMTLDGKIATRTGDSKWISGEESRRRVHELRGRVDAILVGSGTVRVDDPLLTARPPGPRTATRIVVSAAGNLPITCQLLATAKETPVLVFTTEGKRATLGAWLDAGAEVVELPVGIENVLRELGRRRMTNILVEGGAGLLGSFLDAKAIDEAWVFVAPKLVGGTAAPTPIGGTGVAKIAESIRAAESHVEQLGDDVLLTARFS